jgi:hypothetical protein
MSAESSTPKAKKRAQSAAPGPSAKKSGFVLDPDRKAALLSFCIAVMLAATVVALLQPLRPDPRQATRAQKFWYPIETNPYARLTGVSCANDYACRLNDINVIGAGDKREVWAVGNVGLVLHRKPGDIDWEQVRIRAVPDQSLSQLRLGTSTPSPTPTPRPSAGPPKGPEQTSTPSPTVGGNGSDGTAPRTGAGTSGGPEQTSTPRAKVGKNRSDGNAPQPNQVSVPNFVGLTLATAQALAAKNDLQLSVSASGRGFPNSGIQSAPDRSRSPVIKQSPDAGTLVVRGSTVDVVVQELPRNPPGPGAWLDSLLPTVYAAAPKSRESSDAKKPPQTNANRPVTPSTTARGALPTTSDVVAVDDDLLAVDCGQPLDHTCQVIGRSARVYSGPIDQNGIWTFRQLDARRLDSTRLKSATFVPPSFQVSDREPSLDDNHFEQSGDRTNVWRVGDHGIILSSHDGGRTWIHETQGLDGAKLNSRLPAPWYWTLAILMIVLSSAIVAAPAPAPDTEISVADRAVSDAPLKPGERDYLDFIPTVLGLSRFIRNPKTRSPITLAIEGKWGEGKSTLMSFLLGDLKKARFLPVWFNAWHHQSEEQLLAALLESIRQQGLPPWWHVDNGIFRLRLLWIRFSQKWPWMLIVSLALVGSVAYEYAHVQVDEHHSWAQTAINTVGDATAAWHTFWERVNSVSGSRNKENSGSKPEADGKDKKTESSSGDAGANGNARTQPPPDPAGGQGVDLGAYGVVITILGLAFAGWRNFKAFGIDPAKLAGTLRNAASVRDVKPAPGMRRQFQQEFDEVCRAWSWGGRRVIIFIDDLDRCRPDSVVTVLESVNFLTTAGECVIVLGIAPETVTHCVGLSFKDIAEAQALFCGPCITEEEKAKARFDYGSQYIKKLVNISVPLPKTTEKQRRQILERKVVPPSKEVPTEAGWRDRLWAMLSGTGSVVLRLLPLAAIVSLAALAIFMGYHTGIEAKQTPSQNFATDVPTPGPLPTASPAPGTHTTAGDNQPLKYQRPTDQPATVNAIPANTAWRPWWGHLGSAFFLFVLGGLLVYILTARTNEDAENSRPFEDSMEIWDSFIVARCDTPRELKRALNDLRFQAMTRRNEGPSTTRGERLVRRLKQWVTGYHEAVPQQRFKKVESVSQPDREVQEDSGVQAEQQRLNEAELPPRKVAELIPLLPEERSRFWGKDAVAGASDSELFRRLMEAKRKHLARFHRWIPQEGREQSGSDDLSKPDQHAQGAVGGRPH